MKILHTADWHLGKRLGRVDRADDLRRAIEEVIDHCQRREVEVLLIAGDLFDNVHRPDDVRAATDLLRATVAPFLRGGGTILAVTGNHDGEIFPATLQHALALADPAEYALGARIAPGRFYLANRGTFYRLADRAGQEVQFVLTPYPQASHSLDDAKPSHQGSAESRHRAIRLRFADWLVRARNHPKFNSQLHSVLVAHLFLQGATLPNGREVTTDHEKDQIIASSADLGDGWAYVALGDIHKPQTIGGQAHVRYSGSIDRINFDERGDGNQVVFFEIGPAGLVGEPEPIPLRGTPFLDVVINDPSTQLATLKDDYPSADRALVRCEVAYTAGVDDLDAIHRRIDEVFPRCYSRNVVETGRANARAAAAEAGLAAGVVRQGLRETVIDYVKARLEADNHPQAHAEAVLALAEALIAEDQR